MISQKKWFRPKRNVSELAEQILLESARIEKKYNDLDIAHDSVVWKPNHFRGLSIDQFRADNVYVWQSRDGLPENYFITYLYVKKVDKAGLLNSLIEESNYGVESFNFENKIVSRDLMDSIIEITFLDDNLNILNEKKRKILDIGSGYGRLAKRMIQASNNDVICIDAIPLSTCISRVYLQNEIQSQRARVLELDEISSIGKGEVFLAVNIHSFSEMSIESVKFWVQFLRDREIPYIFVVPNGSSLSLNDGSDIEYIFSACGYTVINKEEKYKEEEYNRFAIYPSTYFILELVDKNVLH